MPCLPSFIYIGEQLPRVLLCTVVRVTVSICLRLGDAQPAHAIARAAVILC